MTAWQAASAFAPSAHPVPGGLIRPLANGEAERLAEACAAIDPYRRHAMSVAGLTRYLTHPDAALYRFGIESENALVGVVAIRSPWLRGPFLEMLAILPARQGRGLGRQTVDWVAGQSRLISANLWTTVSDFNDKARAFYQRAGFAEVSELPGLINDGAAEFLLRRRLSDL